MALTADFRQVPVDLTGIGLDNPTSLQFGPDGSLYIAQQNGLIRSVNLQAQVNSIGGSFEIDKFVIDNVGGADVTDLVLGIPNHDDNGDLNESVVGRLVTGILVEEGDNGEVILYVSSSDPRIGAGPSGDDKGLDTNSGIISRLTRTGPNTWEKVDLVIGLPRSEENHATNGLDIRTEIVDGEERQIMYVVSGGNTNRGAPSNNFAWTSEYYYSAAVLRIDLTQLEEIEATEGLKGGTNYVDEYVYALPTLNDPTRPDNGQGQDTANGTTGAADGEAGDTFGGNDGRNQAKYDEGGPVQIYSPGYRNSYDIVITENNNIYTFDNGPNNGWGDRPLEADGTAVFNSTQVASNLPNVNTDTGNDSDPDNLHLVTPGFYGGHPNPVYASGAAANLYWVDTSGGSPVVKQLTDSSDPSNDPTTTLDDLPSDWSTIAGGFTNPEAGVYLTPGSNPFGANKGPDGSLVTIGSSTNGIAEYRAGKTTGSYPITDIPGAEILMAVSFNQNLYFMEIVGDGTQAGTNLTDIEAVLVGGTPLDVRDVEAFAVGTQEFKDSIFIAQFGSDQISALIPSIPLPLPVDKDEDGLKDSIDPLQYDPDNGTNTLLNPGETLFWDLNPIGNHPGPSGDYNIGMTGWMINESWFLEEDGNAPVDDPNRFIDPALVDLNNTIRGGAPGVVQVKSVTPGDLEGTGNNQQDAIQTGFLPGADVSQFTIRVPIFNPFTSDANNGVNFSESASIGFSLGDGTMSNWIGIAVAADDSSGAQVKLTYEENDSTITSLSVDAPELLTAVDDDQVELFLTVDKINGNTYEVTPSWRYQTQGSWSAINQLGSSPVPLNSSGKIVEALQGNKLITGNDGAGGSPVTLQSAPVVTLLATSKGSEPFTADFPELTIFAVNDGPQVLAETLGVTEVAEGGYSDSYSLRLNTQPASDVTVSLSPDDQVALNKTSVVFTPGNWDQPQQVIITAVNDDVFEGNHTGQISHQVTSSDTDYDGLTVPNLAVDVVDNDEPDILYRINAGGPQLASADGSTPDWSEDSNVNPSPFRIPTAGGGNVFTTPDAIDLSDPSLSGSAPQALFQSERWDPPEGEEMQWEFPVTTGSEVEVRLYFAEIYKVLVDAGQRVFDVSVEGVVPTVFDDIDPIGTAGYGGFMLSHTVTVNDGGLSLEFIHGVENPALKGIEIFSKDDTPPNEVSIVNTVDGAEPDVNGQFSVSLTEMAATDTTVTYTVAGTASPDGDYTALTGTVIIPAGSLSAPIDVTVIDDPEVDVDETVIVTLTGATGDAGIELSATTEATVTISDNDSSYSPPLDDLFGTAVEISGNRLNPTDAGILAVGDNVVMATQEGESGENSFRDRDIFTFTVADGFVLTGIELQGYVNNNPLLSLGFFGIQLGNQLTVDVETGVPDPGTDGLLGGIIYNSGNVGDDLLEIMALGGEVQPGFELEPFDPALTGDITAWINQGAGPSTLTLNFIVEPVVVPEVSILGGPYSVGEGEGQVGISLLTDVTAVETVSVTFEIVPGTATVLEDYAYTSETAVFDGQTGVYTDTVMIAGSSSDVTFFVDIVQDLLVEGDEAFTVNITEVSANAQIGTESSASVTITDDDLPNEVSIVNTGDAAEPDVNGQFSVSLTEIAATDTTVTYTVAGTATPETDYGLLTGTVIIAAGSLSAPIDVTVIDDTEVDVDETVIVTVTGATGDANIALSATTEATVTISDDDPVPTNGEAKLEITVNNNNVQDSNFGNNSFQITNTGDKTIAQVEIDVTNALYPDSVFDPFGVAGDTIAKVLTINTPGGTGIVAPNNDPNDPNNQTYIGAGGIAGFEGIQLVFDEAVDGGFNPSESVGFSVDMDPNSIAGAIKSTLDSGAVPAWDIGGVSGAELIGSTFTVTFTDGTTATGQLQGADNQAGSKGLASQDSPDLAVSLTVNGLGAGGVGTYSDGGPSVIVNGPAGETARVVLTKGIIQPVNNNFSEPYASQLNAQLSALAASDFPANNAAEFQTVDVVLTGGDQDISSQFDFTQVAIGNPLAVDEAQVPLGFVASVIDLMNEDLSLGPVTAPIYLQFAEPAGDLEVKLMNANSDSEIVTIEDGSTISDSLIQGLSVTIAAYIPDDSTFANQVGSVVLNLNNGDETQTENVEPYALFGDSNGDFNGQMNFLLPDNTISFNLYSQSGGQGTLLGTVTRNFTIVEDVPTGDPIRLEAEAPSNIVTGDYVNGIENIGVASGDQVLSFLGGSSGESGSVAFTLGNDITGIYNIRVGTFDENDGLARFELELNDDETGTTTEIGTLELNQNLGSNLANAQTFVSPIVATGVSLTAGDTITVNGFEDGLEHARLDFIQLEPVI